MSNGEGSAQNAGPDEPAFRRLEKAVDAAMSRIGTLERELDDAGRQAREMKQQLQRFTGGQEDPSEMISRLRSLEKENGMLLERLNQGRLGVKRMLARIRFLEERG